MKIAIGFKYFEGPYGGGSRFNVSLTKFLRSKNVRVVHELNDSDIDIILLTDPRANCSLCSFNYVDVIKYVRNKKDTLVIQRVNECDERKNTKTINKQLYIGNQCCDATIFIASWLIENFRQKNFYFNNPSVILNGANSSVFKNYDNKIKDKKIRMVTHHWSPNLIKGWDIYDFVDNLSLDEEFKNLEFHYIGNKPKNYNSKRIIFHPPLNNEKLAEELSKYNFYLTASLNEPAGMHHIEGALCGLPILYRKSGALPEYCYKHGIGFENKRDFKSSLLKMMKEFKEFDMETYIYDSNFMNKNYYDFFMKLFRDKNKILESRKFKFNYYSLTRFKMIYFKYKLLSFLKII